MNFLICFFVTYLNHFYREFEQGGQRWIQKVSATPATRKDVEKLNV